MLENSVSQRPTMVLLVYFFPHLEVLTDNWGSVTGIARSSEQNDKPRAASQNSDSCCVISVCSTAGGLVGRL